MSNPNLENNKENLQPADKEFENTIRPAGIEQFHGQPQIIENVRNREYYHRGKV